MGGRLAFRLRPADPEAARELGRAAGVGTATAQVLLHRGIDDAASARAWLSARLALLTPPDGMADRALAADRIARAIRAQERIVVFGDYDVDGMTSAAILADVIGELGGDVVALLASRFGGGYGFSDEALGRCREAGARLIVTCDCGSSDHERIARAAALGIDVVVVDHHLVPSEPLPALAFLNPHRPECAFPYKGLTSAGLCFSVAAALRKAAGVELDLRRQLDLVALGTIADVAPLDGDNRRLVRAGLDRLSARDARPGVVALRALAGVEGRVGAIDVGFRLAPRLNAAGRLGDPAPALALLRARSMPEARALAERLEALNQERRAIERAVTEAAVAQARAIYGERPETGVVVAADGWHAGVVGITASRLVDRFGVPAVVVALDGARGRGSARAPDGFRLHDALTACAGALEAFGGHQAAAGLEVRAERLDALRSAFADASRVAVVGGAPEAPLVDVRLDGNEFPVPEVSDLLRLEPTGEGNAAPLFLVQDAQVERVAAVGQGGAHLKLQLRVGGLSVPAFGYDLGALAPSLGPRVDVLGHARPDAYRGDRSVELRIVACA